MLPRSGRGRRGAPGRWGRDHRERHQKRHRQWHREVPPRQDGGGSGMRGGPASVALSARRCGNEGARRRGGQSAPARRCTRGWAAGTGAARPGAGAGGLAVIFHRHVPGRGGGAATTWRLM